MKTKRGWKRILISVLALAMACACLAGCDGTPEKEPQQTGTGAAKGNVVDYFGDLEIVRASYFNTIGNAAIRTEKERELAHEAYELMQAGGITGEQYREEFLPAMNQASWERTELARQNAAVGTYDPEKEEYILPEEKLPGFLEALRSRGTDGHFGTDYYWGGYHGIRLYTADGSYIEYDGTRATLYENGESKSASFRSLKGGGFWNLVEPWFPQVRYDNLMGDPWNSDEPLEVPDVEAEIPEADRARILAEEVAALDKTWANGKLDYRGILGFTEDMAAHAEPAVTESAEDTADDAGAPGEGAGAGEENKSQEAAR